MGSPGGTFWFRKRKSERVKENKKIDFHDLKFIHILCSK